MPYARNADDGARIYYETAGSRGSPILLHHGFSRSMVEWRPHYEEALAANHVVVLMDSRGHGKSDKPHDPDAYGMRKRVGDVTGVLDALGIEQTHYLGYSMGGHIGFGVARYARERLRSLLVGGMHPYDRESRSAEDRVGALDQGIEAHVAAMEARVGPLPEPFRTEVLANDAAALAAVIRGTAATSGLAGDLQEWTLPALIYAGDQDVLFAGAERAAAEIPSATFAALPGLGHLEAVERHDVALPHILDFLARVEASVAA